MAKKKFDLSSAIGSTINAVEEQQAKFENDFVTKMVHIDELIDYPKQIEMFGEIDTEHPKFQKLLQSVQAVGIQQPLIVRKIDEGYQLLSGHRRKKAAMLSNITEIPSVVKNVDDVDAELIFLTTNTGNRENEDLNDMQRARIIGREKELYAEKIKRGELKGKATAFVAENRGMNVKTVERLDRLNKLIPELQAFVENGKITTGKAQEIALLDEETQKTMYDLMKEQIEELKLEEIKDIRKELETEKSNLLEQLQQLQAEKAEIENKISQEKKNEKELADQIEQLKKQKNISEDEKQRLEKDLTAKLQQAQTQINDLEAKAKEMEDAQKVKDELEKAQKRIQEMEQNNLQILEQEKARLEKESKEKIKEAEKLAQQKAEEKLKQEIEKFQKQIDELNKANEEKENVKALHDELLVAIKSVRMFLDNSLMTIDDAVNNIEEDAFNDECVREFEGLMSALNNFKRFEKYLGKK